MTVTVRPELLKWARERASLDQAELARRVGSNTKPAPIDEWEQSGLLPLDKLEIIAAKTHVPLGYLFLEEPPNEGPALPDFRTPDNGGPKSPSSELIDTIYACTQRQTWFREYQLDQDAGELPFFGKFGADSDTAQLAADIRQVVGWSPEARAAESNLQLVIGRLASAVEEAGILVMRNGVVGNNTHRPLDPNEFRGFALFDTVAPLVFVNAADAPVAQMFTLAHELAHIWIGQSALDDVRILTNQAVERFCNRVAAEVLVPEVEFKTEWIDPAANPVTLERLSRQFRVSRLVILIRALESGLITQQVFSTRYETEKNRPFRVPGESSGGNFYLTQRSRLGRRFPQAVFRSARTGKTLMRDAYDLLSLKKHETYVRLAEAMEVQV